MSSSIITSATTATATATESSTSATSSPTLDPLACPAPFCPSGGVPFDVYRNLNGVPGETYGLGLSPDYYFLLSPLASGFTDTLSIPFFNPGPVDYTTTRTYGGVSFPAYNFTLVAYGYFYANVSGQYTFCSGASGNCDDIDNLYFGSQAAFPCGTPSMPNPEQSSILACQFFTPESCTGIELTAGNYYPIRSVYGNLGLISSLQILITYPGGTSQEIPPDALFPIECFT
ncbi:hypothetical protein RJ55_07790 [Drechmeria coniospora]|nr:hypothetical protein RJ55_07789 [Drechmeria coniospora]ODA76520.1 hypothetical protein RJ55_07790 [Drechmeria coniospora]